MRLVGHALKVWKGNWASLWQKSASAKDKKYKAEIDGMLLFQAEIIENHIRNWGQNDQREFADIKTFTSKKGTNESELSDI